MAFLKYPDSFVLSILQQLIKEPDISVGRHVYRDVFVIRALVGATTITKRLPPRNKIGSLKGSATLKDDPIG